MTSILKLHNQSDEARYYIGKVSEATGASHKAIRHYEARGLIPKARRKGKYRIYSEKDIFVIHMIKHSQTVGFTLEQIRALTSAYLEKSSFPLDLANKLFSQKREELKTRVEEIQVLQTRLEKLNQQMNESFT